MPQETVIPFSWESWDIVTDINQVFNQVTFNSDWGIFKKGDTCEQISIEWDKGELHAYNINGEIVKSQKFIATPIN